MTGGAPGSATGPRVGGLPGRPSRPLGFFISRSADGQGDVSSGLPAKIALKGMSAPRVVGGSLGQSGQPTMARATAMMSSEAAHLSVVEVDAGVAPGGLRRIANPALIPFTAMTPCRTWKWLPLRQLSVASAVRMPLMPAR